MPVLDGIVSGLPKKSHKPIIDGIVTGIAKKKDSLSPEITKVPACATKYSAGVFGAGPQPQGDGDAAGGGHYKGMKIVGK